MKDTIFDLVENQIPEGKKGYFALAENAPEPKDNSFLNTVSDYAKTFLKGSIEGLSRLGQMMGPIPSKQGKTEEQELESQTETLNKLFPTDEGFVQKGLRRGLQQAPTAMAFPLGGPVQAGVRGIGAGFAGEGAKELGAPEWLQTAAELTAYIGPDITKKLLEKGSNTEIIKAGRKLGISDEALTLLLQSERKQKWLSKFTPRRGTIKTALEKIKSELQEAYGKVSESLPSKQHLSHESSIKLIDDIEDKLLKMPSGVRSKIKTDFDDLLKGEITGENLINFWSDINHEMGNTSKELSLLKEPIKNALKEISPELIHDFETVNALYSKYFSIAKRLEPNLKTDIMEAVKPLGLLGGLLTGNYGLIAKFSSPYLLGELSKQMLTNPRFQQLSQKMVESMIQNKFSMAKKIVDLIAAEVKKISPDAASEIENISEEDLMELIKKPHSS